MADDEKWGLSREEIDKWVRELNQKKKAQGPTQGGRSSGQGVKFGWFVIQHHRVVGPVRYNVITQRERKFRSLSLLPQ